MTSCISCGEELRTTTSRLTGTCDDCRAVLVRDAEEFVRGAA